MLAELYLRVAADPNAVRSLTTAELGELLAEPVPPLWVFTEAARRRHEVTVMTQLFSHPEAPYNSLERAVGTDAKRRMRFDHHVNVYTGPLPTIATILSQIVPERIAYDLVPNQEVLLTKQLGRVCSPALRPSLRYNPAKASLDNRCGGTPTEFYNAVPRGASPRSDDPLSRFLLLGDFLYYLTCPPPVAACNLPVMAKVALALNAQQPLERHLADADVRVRAAAEERMGWNES